MGAVDLELHAFELGTGWRLVAGLVPRSLCSMARHYSTVENSTLWATAILCVLSEEDMTFLPEPRVETRFYRCQSSDLGTIPTELCRLNIA